MLASQTPTLVPLAFAANGTKNTIPEASQIGITPGAASLNDGFPPLTFTPIAAGGTPPAGADFNGVLNLITQSIRWAHGGGRYAWNSAFALDTNVNGYPNGAHLLRADLTGDWINTVDGNQTNPDAVDGSAAGWVPGYNYGVYAVTGLTNANVTLFPLQAAKSKITLAGALTGNVQIIFPAWTKEWEVVNNTTGAFTVTAKTAAGTGIALAAGQQKITGDGTNITQPAENIAAATLPTHAMQFGQATGRVFGPPQTFLSTAPYNPSSPLITHVYYKLQGGGAGSAGSVATSSSQVSVGGPGAAGGYCEGYLPVSAVAGTTVVIGAAGAAGLAGAAGGNGGNSSFGGAIAGGGGGGGVSGAGTSELAGSSSNGAASGGNIKNLPGAGGALSYGIAATGFPFAFAGVGANSPMGGAGGTGGGGVGYGGGAGGTANTVSQPAVPGHAGFQGFAEIWELI